MTLVEASSSSAPAWSGAGVPRSSTGTSGRSVVVEEEREVEAEGTEEWARVQRKQRARAKVQVGSAAAGPSHATRDGNAARTAREGEWPAVQGRSAAGSSDLLATVQYSGAAGLDVPELAPRAVPQVSLFDLAFSQQLPSQSGADSTTGTARAAVMLGSPAACTAASNVFQPESAAAKKGKAEEVAAAATKRVEKACAAATKASALVMARKTEEEACLMALKEANEHMQASTKIAEAASLAKSGAEREQSIAAKKAQQAVAAVKKAEKEMAAKSAAVVMKEDTSKSSGSQLSTSVAVEAASAAGAMHKFVVAALSALSQKRCANYHVLQKHTLKARGHRCDYCGSSLKPNSVSLRCELCDRDACLKCASIAAQCISDELRYEITEHLQGQVSELRKAERADEAAALVRKVKARFRDDPVDTYKRFGIVLQAHAD